MANEKIEDRKNEIHVEYFLPRRTVSTMIIPIVTEKTSIRIE